MTITNGYLTQAEAVAYVGQNLVQDTSLLDDVEIVGVAPTEFRADGSRGWEAKSASAPLVTAFRALPPRRG